jgi:hypothetical protein
MSNSTYGTDSCGPEISLSNLEVAHVLAASVSRRIRLGAARQDAIREVALDNRVTGNCVIAALKMVAREAGA